MTHPIVSLFLQYLGCWSHYHDDCEISLPCRVRVYPEGRKNEGNMGREELWSCYFFVGLFFLLPFPINSLVIIIFKVMGSSTASASETLCRSLLSTCTVAGIFIFFGAFLTSRSFSAAAQVVRMRWSKRAERITWILAPWLLLRRGGKRRRGWLVWWRRWTCRRRRSPTKRIGDRPENVLCHGLLSLFL